MNSSLTTPCQVCGQTIKEIYCTTNTCRDCCKHGRCPIRLGCTAYALFLREELEKEQIEKYFNPSSRRGID